MFLGFRTFIVGFVVCGVCTAWTLNSLGFSVGICDLDLCGPSIPLMLRMKGAEILQSAEGWEPAFVRPDLCVMSIGKPFYFGLLGFTRVY